MPGSQSMTVHLSPEARAFIRQQVELGEYASEDDVLNEGVASLRLEVEERTRWIREEVVAAYDEHVADPSSALTFDELQRDMAAWRAERKVFA